MSGAPPARSRRIIVAYDYHDEHNVLLFQVCRYDPKDFRVRRPDATAPDGWTWNLTNTRRVLYRLPALLAADPAAPVYIVEGEKDADALAAFGVVATSNPGGAGKWRPECNEPLRDRHAIILPDNDDAGRAHAERVSASLRDVAASVRVVPLPKLPDKGDVSDWIAAGGTRAALEALAAEPLPAPDVRRGVWAAALAAPDFLETTEPDASWLEPDMLARGSVTEWFSPRGLGKTHVALAIAVRLARAGKRVLLLDRDNSRREVRRRLHAWGAADAATLWVMTRDAVPPLTDTAAWRSFPFREYDLVIIDALDASTEGVGEQDSSKPSRAIAPVLDIAHRENGPAILVLGNTIKSGAHGRSSGVVEDRADIVYEVRDATDFVPTPGTEWWKVLPAAGRGDWADRAARRKRRDTYRLAFVPSKFRLGEEPEPFVLEIDLAAAPWALRDATATLVHEGEAAAAAAHHAAIDAVRAAAEGAAAKAGKPLKRQEAEALLSERGLTRKAARALLDDQNGIAWTLEKREHERGRPVYVHATARIIPTAETPYGAMVSPAPILAIHANVDGENGRPLKAMQDTAKRAGGLFSPSSPIDDEGAI